MTEPVTAFEPPKPDAAPLPAAEFQAPPAPGKVEYEAFPIKQASEDLDDFKVKVRASTLRRARSKLQSVKEPTFPWHEVTLGACTLAYGGFLGALPAQLTAGGGQAIFFYTVLPVIGTGTLVAYLFLRRPSHNSPARMAGEALAELPDPDKAR